jgi:hypothetical protein
MSAASQEFAPSVAFLFRQDTDETRFFFITLSSSIQSIHINQVTKRVTERKRTVNNFRPLAPGRLALDGVLRNGFLLVNVHPLVHIQAEGSIGIHMLIEERC